MVIGAFCHFSDCSNEKVEFPVFKNTNFINLYSRKKDEDTPYVSSLKKIYCIPDLFDIVGPGNQLLINEYLDYLNEKDINNHPHY